MIYFLFKLSYNDYIELGVIFMTQKVKVKLEAEKSLLQKELRSPKYRQRVVELKTKYKREKRVKFDPLSFTFRVT